MLQVIHNGVVQDCLVVYSVRISCRIYSDLCICVLVTMQNYEQKRVVGEGSFGKALLCIRRKDGKQCIIKQISLHKLSSKDALATEQEVT